MNVTEHGIFHVDCVNPDGSIAWSDDFQNAMTTVGANAMLDVTFNSGTQVTTWYLGLVSATGFSSFAIGDTSASHAGWVESAAYSESTRPQWTVGSASGGSSTNAAVVTFTSNATPTIHGIFCISNSTKSGTTGTLWATGAFSADQTLASGQALKVTYTISLTAA